MKLKPGKCKHFNGVLDAACEAGVNYKQLPGFPCIKRLKGGAGGKAAASCCGKYEEPTAEEIAQSEAEHKANLEEMEARIRNATPKGRTRPYSVWFDETAPGQEFTHEQFLARLREVHGIDPTTKGTRQMVCHMDGDTWFSYVWEWVIGGKKFTNSTRQNRRGACREIWARGGR